MAGRTSTSSAARRDPVETAMLALATALVLIDEVELRNRQALRRSSVVADVLEPNVERIAALRQDIRLAKQCLNSAWAVGQERKWEIDNG